MASLASGKREELHPLYRLYGVLDRYITIAYQVNSEFRGTGSRGEKKGKG